MNTFIANEEPQWIELGGGQRRKIRAYNENVMLVEVGFDTGAVGAAHSHPHTQISYVLDGEFTYTVEGVTRSMKKGDSIAVEGGKVIAAAWSGKIKTASTMVCFILLMLPVPDWTVTACWIVVLATTVYSGIEYFAKNASVFK